MQIYLGADHGGLQLKEDFRHYLLGTHPELNTQDLGAFVYDANDDYPDFAFQVAEKIQAADDLGILLCRSGSGMVIAANKVKGVRAVELYDEKIAAHAKSHNHANVIAFSGDYLSLQEMIRLFEVFLSTALDSSERHQRRINQIINFEER